MNLPHGLRRLVGPSLVALLFEGGLLFAQQPGEPAVAGKTELRWTPHRTATGSRSGGIDAPGMTSSDAGGPVNTFPADQAPATVQAAPQTVSPTTTRGAAAPGAARPAPVAPRMASAPPASVGLPATVPAITGPARAQTPPRPATTRPRPPAPTGDWKSENRIAGPVRTSTPGEGRMSLPGLGEVNMFRAPQGESGRPVLAVEGAPPGASRPVSVPALGGGLAPRFNPRDTPTTGFPADAAFSQTAARQTPGRRERLALNDADGLPSVMAQATPVPAPADTVAPGRLPTAATPPSQTLPPPAAGSMTLQNDPSITINTLPSDMTEYGDESFGMGTADMAPADGMWMGDYPSELHVESFYDDPFACEESAGLLTCWPHDGRICAWLRQFGKPYYGWRWYRDFTASAGITAFQNQSNLGLFGNYGTNEFINWAMPFWNAFGVGWQVGVRGVQSNFNQTTVNDLSGRLPGNSRQQVFVTTGFFTRAFEGRGLQGGAVYDYMGDSYFENVDVAQIRGELSYVWGFHELGFWGAFNSMEQQGLFGPALKTPGVAGTVDLYTAFYRLHFGDANEARVWGGASGDGQGVIGAQIRAPMSRSLAMDGTFTYLMPSKSQTIELGPGSSATFAPSAWNLSVNLVWYPAGRARRSLASPYRPLFEVADNGSMIRTLARTPTP